MEPITNEQKLTELQTKIENSIKIIENCPVESVRASTADKLSTYQSDVWQIAAADPVHFDTVKELSDLCEKHMPKGKGRGPSAPKVKQPTAKEVQMALSQLKWDGTVRLGDEQFWKRLLGGSAIYRVGAEVSPVTRKCEEFMRAVILRMFRPGSAVAPLILIGPKSVDLAGRLSPSCLPEPYRTSVGHLVPARASLITLFDGVGSSLDAGPFATADKGEGDASLLRWFSPVCYVKRPTAVTDAAGALICQGDPEDVTADEILQLWAETYKATYDSGEHI